MNNTDNKYKNYIPVIMEYDPKVDGGNEHMIRDEHLSEKERLHKVIAELKNKQRGSNKVRRWYNKINLLTLTSLLC